MGELQEKLQKEGRKKVTAEEMKEVLKKERRKAEKALANSKKNVCFHCRQPGHMLIECPDSKMAKKSNMAGKCFKCGSSEHTSKLCPSKLHGADAYRFAD